MSEIIGNTAVLIAAEYMSNPKYGKGEMLGGFPGIKPTELIIIGAGTVAERRRHPPLAGSDPGGVRGLREGADPQPYPDRPAPKPGAGGPRRWSLGAGRRQLPGGAEAQSP